MAIVTELWVMEICGTYSDYSGILSILITAVIQVIPYLLSPEFYVDSENDYSPIWEYFASMW